MGVTTSRTNVKNRKFANDQNYKIKRFETRKVQSVCLFNKSRKDTARFASTWTADSCLTYADSALSRLKEIGSRTRPLDFLTKFLFFLNMAVNKYLQVLLLIQRPKSVAVFLLCLKGIFNVFV